MNIYFSQKKGIHLWEDVKPRKIINEIITVSYLFRDWSFLFKFCNKVFTLQNQISGKWLLVSNTGAYFNPTSKLWEINTLKQFKSNTKGLQIIKKAHSKDGILFTKLEETNIPVKENILQNLLSPMIFYLLHIDIEEKNLDELHELIFSNPIKPEFIPVLEKNIGELVFLISGSDETYWICQFIGFSKMFKWEHEKDFPNIEFIRTDWDEFINKYYDN